MSSLPDSGPDVAAVMPKVIVEKAEIRRIGASGPPRGSSLDDLIGARTPVAKISTAPGAKTGDSVAEQEPGIGGFTRANQAVAKVMYFSIP